MNPVMAFGMKQDAVLGIALTTHHPGDTIVKKPPGEAGESGVARNAKAALFIPKKTKKTRTLKRALHMIRFAFLEVGFIGRVVGVRLAFNLDMPTNGSVSGQE
jgi:hypothetical protein